MKKAISLSFRLLTIGFVSILLLCLDDQLVFGEEIGFSVQADLPENQLNKEVSYYDLRMQPGQKQEILLRISNTSNQEQTYEINVNQAYTNKNGFIDYEQKDVAIDDSQQYPLKDIAVHDSEITVPPQTSINFPIQLNMPAAAFDGEILGGIQVLKKTKETEGKIVNRYGYIIGLRLTETDTPIERRLELKDVRAEKAFGSTGVVADIQNPVMEGIGHLKYELLIKNHQNKTVREKVYDKEMSIAPNSTYTFVVDWEKKPLEAGEYLFYLTISDAKGNRWNFKKPFTISEKEAKKVNQALVPITPSSNRPSWLFVLLGILSAGAVFLLFLQRQKKLTQLQPVITETNDGEMSKAVEEQPETKI
ncbi:DUF916 and DUF3324 domain-containing protein [Enterococcus sp. LJL128]|uniref:DUF916 and DUF3324 domain-containing protein n=1 Tax=Enterococcus sp. LJL51 TaxID=3416656 RepID=UPI003CEE0C5F